MAEVTTVYFIDDFNMPDPDKYGTQSAIAILRQHKDYGGFYDLKTLRMKKLDSTQLVAAMNPTAGSFFIIDRMQRHFATFGTPPPEAAVLSSPPPCLRAPCSCVTDVERER